MSRVGSSGQLDITQGRGLTGFLFPFHECKRGLKIFLCVRGHGLHIPSYPFQKILIIFHTTCKLCELFIVLQAMQTTNKILFTFYCCCRCYHFDNNFYLPKPCCLQILKVKFDNQESWYVSVYDYFLHVSSCHNNIAILKGQSAFTLMKEKT